MARIREHFLATTLCVLWAWSRPAYAEPLQVGLRLAEPADRSLGARLRGQTGDLDVALQGLETGPTEPTFAAQLDTARVLAKERGWRVVVWAVRHGGVFELVVADFALDRVLVRPLSFESSAQEEAAALVVRSALRASLAGSALGKPSAELAPDEEPEVEPEPPAPVEPPVAPLRRRLSVGEFGALSGLDGAGGHHALFLRLFWHVAHLQLGVLGGLGFSVRVDEPLADVKLALHRLEASAGFHVQRNAWSIVPSLALGVHRYTLKADDRDPRLATQNAQRNTLALAAFVRVEYDLGLVGISLRVGAAVLPKPPQLGYQAATFTRTRELWPVQPELGLALTL